MNVQRPQLPPEEQHLLESVDFLRKRWKLVAAVFLGVVGVAAAVSLRIDPVYRAKARVVVGAGGSRSPLSDRGSAIEGYLLEQRSFETQIEIIGSEPVAERAARTLGRIDDDTDPDRRVAVVASFRHALNVDRVRDTRIVVLSLSHRDPDVARDVTNAMAQAYIEYTEEQRASARARSIEWLTDETAKARKEVRASEERLVDYIASKGIDFAAEGDLGGGASDATLDGLRAEIAAAEVELAQLRRRYRDLHPKVRDLVAHLEGLRGRVESEQVAQGSSHRKLIQYRILRRDVELDHELYQVLLKKLKEADLTAGAGDTDIRILESATLPRVPIGPHSARMIAIAAVLGLCLGLGAAFGAETLDRTVRSSEDVQRVFGLPTLALVRRFDTLQGRPLVAEASRSPAGEMFRTLRTNVRFCHVDRPRRVVLVTSTGPEEGKSTVLANLAVSLAQSGRRTLVVDTDLRRPSLHRFFRMGEQGGLADLLAGDAAVEETIRESHIENLDVLTAGTLPPNPAELIESIRLQELLTSLRETYDYVLLDSPPAGGLIDSSLMCPLVDGVVYVVERGRFDHKIVRTALAQLERAGGKLYGVVLNKAPVDDRAALYGYYRYGSDVPDDADASPAAAA